VYDVMEAKGLFDMNAANSSSPQYQGPVEYPKMYYHPKGLKRVIQKAELLQTPFGPQKVGEQFELISRLAQSKEDEERLVRAGWHDHPAKAIAASGENAPPMTAHGRIADLERQLKVLENQLIAARAAPPPEPTEDELLDLPPDTSPPARPPAVALGAGRK
jgi:hypothetical protein